MRAPRPKKKVRQPRSPGPGRSSFLCGFCVSSECLVVDLSGEEVVFPSYPSPGPPSSASLESRRQSGRQDGPKTFPRCPPDPPAPRPRSPQDPPSPQIAVGPPKIGPRSTTIAPRPPRPPKDPLRSLQDQRLDLQNSPRASPSKKHRTLENEQKTFQNH